MVLGVAGLDREVYGIRMTSFCPCTSQRSQSTGFGMVHSGIRAVKMGSWGRNERFWAPKGRNNHSQAFEWQGLGLRGFQWNGSKRNIYGVGMTMHDRFGLLEDPGVGVAGAGNGRFPVERGQNERLAACRVKEKVCRWQEGGLI